MLRKKGFAYAKTFTEKTMGIFFFDFQTFQISNHKLLGPVYIWCTKNRTDDSSNTAEDQASP
ncbi:hypothetical protein CW714_04735 [Methanophagales archaeon]|nr:MAG: hypothetical protein CW714_04735 [Methanophagales archaeon]